MTIKALLDQQKAVAEIWNKIEAGEPIDQSMLDEASRLGKAAEREHEVNLWNDFLREVFG